jgi:hypothetical protein
MSDPPQNTTSMFSIGNDSFHFRTRIVTKRCSSFRVQISLDMLLSTIRFLFGVLLFSSLDTENRLPEVSDVDPSGHVFVNVWSEQTSHCLTCTCPPAPALPSIALLYLVKNAPKAAAAIGTALALVDAGCCS